jgi:hypothetical protein
MGDSVNVDGCWIFVTMFRPIPDAQRVKRTVTHVGLQPLFDRVHDGLICTSGSLALLFKIDGRKGKGQGEGTIT